MGSPGAIEDTYGGAGEEIAEEKFELVVAVGEEDGEGEDANKNTKNVWFPAIFA